MMDKAEKLPEVWMRGPIADVPAILQPLVFALMQAREEITGLMKDFPDELLWIKPAGVASPGFHLQHLSGVLSRLFTYADNRQLTPEQLKYLAAEGKQEETNDRVQQLVDRFNQQVETAIGHLKNADVNTLTEHRGVGRAMLPSTVMGLYTHAAEHTMRHTGQLLVTVKILKANWQDAQSNSLAE